MDLDKFIYRYNMITTKSMTREQMCLINPPKRELNIDNAISFYDIIEKFNNEYLDFKNDYESLPKLNLGKKIIFNYYSIGSVSRNLSLTIDEPSNINKEDIVLNLIQYEDEYFHKIPSDDPMDEDYVNNKKINLSNEVITEYLDLCDRHKDFLDSFEKLRNAFLFGNACDTLFTSIDGDIFNNLDKFKIAFGSGFINSEYFISCYAKLGDNLKILDDGEFIIDSTNYDGNDIKVDLLHNLYIDKSYLPDIYSNCVNKNLVKKL